MSCTGAIESAAATIDDVLIEVAATRITERGATRADDRLSEAAMDALRTERPDAWLTSARSRRVKV